MSAAVTCDGGSETTSSEQVGSKEHERERKRGKSSQPKRRRGRRRSAGDGRFPGSATAERSSAERAEIEVRAARTRREAQACRPSQVAGPRAASQRLAHAACRELKANSEISLVLQLNQEGERMQER